jgi:hypothetical protein
MHCTPDNKNTSTVEYSLVGFFGDNLNEVREKKKKNNNQIKGKGISVEIWNNNGELSIAVYSGDCDDDIEGESFTYCIFEESYESAVTLVEFLNKDIPKIVGQVEYVYHNYNDQGISEDDPDLYFDDYEFDDENESVQPFPGDCLWITLDDYNRLIKNC